MIKELINDSPWLTALIILITQIIFLYFRTLNVIFTAEKKLIPSILTGIVIGASWLIIITIGANAILELQFQPIIAHLLGGAIGTWWAMRNKYLK